jgi:hypothetical protein
MKIRLGLLCALAATSASIVGCGGSDDSSNIPAGTGGTAGSGGGKAGSAGSGAKAGNGGSAGSGTGGATGGTSGKGGSAGATGGSSGKGGSAGATGGSSGKGGSAGATGGSSGKGGSAGATGGTAGSAGKGGSTGGSAGASGKGGSAGATGGTGGSTGGSGGATGGTGGTTGGSGGATGGSAGATGGSGGSAGAPPVTCMGTNTACLTSGGKNGLCVGGLCSDCNAPADDATCVAAYAGAADLCADGSCVKCDAVGSTYVVDPVNGNDAATGSGTAGGAAAGKCALKTVSAAIKAVNAVGGAGPFTIEIVGPSSPAASDVYPWVIPAHTTLTTTGLVTVPGAGATYAVRINAPGSGIDATGGLVIDLATAAGTPHGIDVTSGADDTSFIRNVTVQNAVGGGIVVNGGAAGSAHVTIGAGVEVLGNGKNANAGNRRAGLQVGDGDAFVTIAVPAGGAPTLFQDSGSYGISVTGNGGVSITGVPDATPGLGTVVSKANGANGISIQAVGAGGNPAKQNTLDGFVTFGNGVLQNSSGMTLNGTSLVKVRNCVSLANSLNGINVTQPQGTPGALGVDLGTAVDGKNLVQHTNAEGNINLGVGICFGWNSMMPVTLPAEGNLFGTGKDCSTTMATLTAGTGGNPCSGGKDYGVTGNGVIDIKSCKLPSRSHAPAPLVESSDEGRGRFVRPTMRARPTASPKVKTAFGSSPLGPLGRAAPGARSAAAPVLLVVGWLRAPEAWEDRWREVQPAQRRRAGARALATLGPERAEPEAVAVAERVARLVLLGPADPPRKAAPPEQAAGAGQPARPASGVSAERAVPQGRALREPGAAPAHRRALAA